MKDTITFKGDKELWNKFVENLKINKKEIWDILRPYIEANSDIEFEKMLQFATATLSEYNQDRIIDKIVSVWKVETANGSFHTFNFKIPMERGTLQKSDSEVYHSPEIFGLGHELAMAERDYLIKRILALGIKIVAINLLDITIDFLEQHTKHYSGRVSVLLPAQLIPQLYDNRQSQYRFNYHGRITKLDNRVQLFFVPEAVIGKKIIILDGYSCIWSQLHDYSSITEKPEPLQILVGEKNRNESINIYVKIQNKLTFRASDRIKIFEIEDAMGTDKVQTVELKVRKNVREV